MAGPCRSKCAGVVVNTKINIDIIEGVMVTKISETAWERSNSHMAVLSRGVVILLQMHGVSLNVRLACSEALDCTARLDCCTLKENNMPEIQAWAIPVYKHMLFPQQTWKASLWTPTAEECGGLRDVFILICWCCWVCGQMAKWFSWSIHFICPFRCLLWFYVRMCVCVCVRVVLHCGSALGVYPNLFMCGCNWCCVHCVGSSTHKLPVEFFFLFLTTDLEVEPLNCPGSLAMLPLKV